MTTTSRQPDGPAPGPAADLASGYALLTDLVASLADQDFSRSTRAAEWNVKELLFHLSLDATRALAALASTTDRAADVDAVSYWRPFRPSEGDGGAAHARFVRVSASAFTGHDGLVGWWRTLSDGVARAAAVADPNARVETQGHVIGVPDLLSTLLVEATIHHLDLIAEMPDAPGPARAGLAETRRVLGALLGAPVPDRWDDATAALKGTGRVELDAEDRHDLGDRAAAVPLLG